MTQTRTMSNSTPPQDKKIIAASDGTAGISASVEFVGGILSRLRTGQTLFFVLSLRRASGPAIKRRRCGSAAGAGGDALPRSQVVGSRSRVTAVAGVSA